MIVTKSDVETTKRRILDLHNKIIDVSGGEKGVRDDGGLEHAIERILSVENKEKNAVKVAARAYLMMAGRHYFVDGNKRTAHIVAKLLLLNGRIHFKTHYKDAVGFIMDIATENKSIEEIIKWINENSEILPEGADIAKHMAECDEDIDEMKEFMRKHFGTSV